MEHTLSTHIRIVGAQLKRFDRTLDRLARWLLKKPLTQKLLRLSFRSGVYLSLAVASLHLASHLVAKAHCSLVGCAEAHQELTFGELPDVDISLPPRPTFGSLPDVTLSLPEAPHGAAPADPQAVLARACDHDARCICINNAIFKHDSSWATKGVGRKTNNPGNMRPPSSWKPSVPMGVYASPGNGYFAKFDTLEDGIIANVELYKRHYAHFTSARALVSRWAGGGGQGGYTNAVASCF